MRPLYLLLLPLLASAQAPPVVVDFEGPAVLLSPGDKANRMEQWENQGVVFRLAQEPRTTKAKGLIMFFEHLSTGNKGLGSAMALEQIPVRATFAKPAATVTVSFWGSTGTPALLEAFDAEGNVVDRATVAAAPSRKAPGDPVPIFSLTVRAKRIAYIQFSGPRPGEYLAADELRYTPAE
jgi:hypothetical protein